VENLLASLRNNLLEIKQAQAIASYTNAPTIAAAENAGSAEKLDTFIDLAPAAIHQADAFAPLRALLIAQQPDASLEVFPRAHRRMAFLFRCKPRWFFRPSADGMRMRCVRHFRKRCRKLDCRKARRWLEKRKSAAASILRWMAPRLSTLQWMENNCCLPTMLS